MKITVLIQETEAVVNVEVDPQDYVEDLKALVEVESGVLIADQILHFTGVELNNLERIGKYNLQPDDVVLLTKRAAGLVQQQRSARVTAEGVRDYIRSNPQMLQQLLHNNPTMAEAVLSDDITLLENLLAEQEGRRRQVEAERFRHVNTLNADPLDPSAQMKIEEEIRMENVNSNMETAIEHNPEAFARVTMLFIDCEVNNTPVKAFVDSGAQSTIMSADCAARCGIMRLIDKRFAGFAKGVGTARILGRVHVAPIKIGQSFFSSSFTILEDQSMDFLLGLDYLRKHQCCIDLKANVLRIGEEIVPFLAEKDIPHNLRGSTDDLAERTDPPAHTSSTSTSVPTASTGPSAGNAMNTTFPESIISELMKLGFSRQRVLEALQVCGGNPELAASQLTFGF